MKTNAMISLDVEVRQKAIKILNHQNQTLSGFVTEKLQELIEKKA